MKTFNNLDFFSDYQKRLKEYGEQIKKQLPNMWEPENWNEDGLLNFVPLTKIGNTWDVATIKSEYAGQSENLKELAYKIEYMIGLNRANDIEPMLRSIISGKVKVWKSLGGFGVRLKRRERKKNYHDTEDSEHQQDFIYGHFRINFKGHVLTDNELQRVKEYFKL